MTKRRDFLKAGMLAAGGLRLPELLAADGEARARSCIILFMSGGPSQLDTFDPKPEAPLEVRGPVGTIATAVPGVWSAVASRP